MVARVYMSSGNFDKRSNEFLINSFITWYISHCWTYYLYCLFYFIIRRPNLESGGKKKVEKLLITSWNRRLYLKGKRIFNNKKTCFNNKICLKLFCYRRIFLIKLISFFIDSHLLIYLSQSGSSRIIFSPFSRLSKKLKKNSEIPIDV